MTRTTRLMYTLATAIGCLVIAAGALYYLHFHQTTGTAQAVNTAVAKLQHQAAPTRPTAPSTTKQSGTQPSPLPSPNKPIGTSTSTPTTLLPPVIKGTVKQVTSDGLVVQTTDFGVVPVWVDGKTRFTDKAAKISLQQITSGSAVTVVDNSIDHRLLALSVQTY